MASPWAAAVGARLGCYARPPGTAVSVALLHYHLRDDDEDGLPMGRACVLAVDADPAPLALVGDATGPDGDVWAAAERALVAHARMLPTADQFADSFVGWQFAPASDAGVGIVVAVHCAGLSSARANALPGPRVCKAAVPPWLAALAAQMRDTKAFHCDLCARPPQAPAGAAPST